MKGFNYRAWANRNVRVERRPAENAATESATVEITPALNGTRDFSPLEHLLYTAGSLLVLAGVVKAITWGFSHLLNLHL